MYNTVDILRVLSKENGEVFIDWEEAVEGVGLQKFPGPSVGQQVPQSPVGVGRPDQSPRPMHRWLRIQEQPLPPCIARERRTQIVSVGMQKKLVPF